MHVPILFIHYGNSSFLPYVVDLARRFNPTKEVIFLGDETNAHVRQRGVTHLPFADYAHGQEIALFDTHFPAIENGRYAKKRWANFILRRWFIIHNFIRKHHIQRFWTFDTDNFLLTDLRHYELLFSSYECTSQCKGSCLNGFIPEQAVVTNYINKINDLLANKEYTALWQEKYKAKPDLFYTEMEAFAVFVREEGVKNLHIARIYEDAAFEDSITYATDGMEMYARKIKGRLVKKLYACNGKIYCKHLASGKFIKMNNLNLSWMPKYVFPRIHESIVAAPPSDEMVLIDLLKAPLSYHLKYFAKKLIPPVLRDRLSRGSYWV